MKKIAILGGTFNPVHNGHLKLAENTWRQFSLDEFWFLPSPNPPHKQGRTITDFSHRFEMTKLAIRKYPSFVCSDFETRRTGKSYTSDTLTELKQLHPDTEFYFVMGADSFYEFGNWHEPETISKLATIIVADRDYEKSHSDRDVQEKFLRETFGTRVLFVRAAVFYCQNIAGSLHVSTEGFPFPALQNSRPSTYIKNLLQIVNILFAFSSFIRYNQRKNG